MCSPFELHEARTAEPSRLAGGLEDGHTSTRLNGIQAAADRMPHSSSSQGTMYLCSSLRGLTIFLRLCPGLPSLGNVPRHLCPFPDVSGCCSSSAEPPVPFLHSLPVISTTTSLDCLSSLDCRTQAADSFRSMNPALREDQPPVVKWSLSYETLVSHLTRSVLSMGNAAFSL